MYNNEIVLQMPVNTLQELTEKEQAEDYNMLLNESWEHYAQRAGINGTNNANSNTRTKWLTETWAENQERKKRQEVYINSKMEQMAKETDDAAMKEHARNAISQHVVQMLMRREEQARNKATQSRHYLFTDYVELQEEKFSAERCSVTSSEEMTRMFIQYGEEMMAEMLARCKSSRIAMCAQMEAERLKAEQEERKRYEEEERLREIEEARLQKERERREEERIRQAREEAEMNKRLERKRRDEERRARVRGAAITKSQTETE